MTSFITNARMYSVTPEVEDIRLKAIPVTIIELHCRPAFLESPLRHDVILTDRLPKSLGYRQGLRDAAVA